MQKKRMLAKDNDQGVRVEDMLEVKRRFRESGNRTSLLPTIMPKTSSSTQAMSTQNLKRSLIGHQDFSTIGAEALGKAASSLDPYGLG